MRPPICDKTAPPPIWKILDPPLLVHGKHHFFIYKRNYGKLQNWTFAFSFLSRIVICHIPDKRQNNLQEFSPLFDSHRNPPSPVRDRCLWAILQTVKRVFVDINKGASCVSCSFDDKMFIDWEAKPLGAG